MEFYYFSTFTEVVCSLFQFPTGWNSTVRDGIDQFINNVFQFPTGWNSTGSAAAPSEFVGGFNSQRDGILLAGRALLARENRVSIPNGMEFYCTKFIFTFKKLEGFNSQRDGILPKPSFPARLQIQCFNSQRDGILQ